jgi:carbon monoxide dehydrogenase subunit G
VFYKGDCVARVVVRIDIDASVERVWQELEALERHINWMSDAESIAFASESTRGVGTVIEVETKVGPFRLLDVMEFTEWVPHSVMAVDHRGLVSGTGAFTLEPTSAGTTMTWVEDLRFPWYLGGGVTALAARPVLSAIWRKNLRRFAATV